MAMPDVDRAKVAIMTVPTLNDVVAGKGSGARIRKVAVDDLMKREPVTLDDAGLQNRTPFTITSNLTCLKGTK